MGTESHPVVARLDTSISQIQFLAETSSREALLRACACRRFLTTEVVVDRGFENPY